MTKLKSVVHSALVLVVLFSLWPSASYAQVCRGYSRFCWTVTERR